jgi:Flp pilus assembly protein TadB
MSTSGIFWNSASVVANTFWAIFEIIGLIVTAYFVIHKSHKNKEIATTLLETRAETLEEELSARDTRDAIKTQLENMDNKFDTQHLETLKILNNVNYAIFNAGKTGLKNRVDDLWDIVPKMQQDLATLVERTRNL